VGKTIAAIAQPGDDISSLELPETESGMESAGASAKEEAADAPVENSAAEPAGKSTAASGSGKADASQTLFPSVQNLLIESGVTSEDALVKIPASGPKGRLLKGDVLAYLGKVSQESIDSVTSQIKKLEKLDLSNIKLREQSSSAVKASAPSAEAPKKKVVSEKPAPEPFRTKSVNVSLDGVSELQKTIEEAFGNVSLSSLIEKAAALASRDSVRFSKPAPSVLHDPDFEYLITPKSSKVPFTYSFAIRAPAVTPAAQQNAVFDLLTGGPTRKGTGRSPAPPTATPAEVSVDVKIDNTVANSELKADIFIAQLKYYLGEGKGELVL
jgi:pyruvate dehydrogenase E2 component (dihydrolipoamide acetyltransferase)